MPLCQSGDQFESRKNFKVIYCQVESKAENCRLCQAKGLIDYFSSLIYGSIEYSVGSIRPKQSVI